MLFGFVRGFLFGFCLFEVFWFGSFCVFLIFCCFWRRFFWLIGWLDFILRFFRITGIREVDLVEFLLLLFCNTVQSAFLADLTEQLFHQIYFSSGRCLDWLAENILEQYCRMFCGFLCLIVVCTGNGAWDIMNILSIELGPYLLFMFIHTNLRRLKDNPYSFKLSICEPLHLF